MTNQDILIAAGVDYEKTLKRFSGNAALLERFARKFPTDPSFSQLDEAMAEKRYEDAEHAAHTLKGVAGNLGFQRLSELSGDVVEELRTGAFAEAETRFAAVAADYIQACECLKQLP